MEEHSGRKRKHSSSDEDDLDLNINDLTENTKKLKEHIKSEQEDTKVKEEPRLSDVSATEHAQSVKTEPTAIKEEADDRYSSPSDNQIRHSIDSDSDDDHTNEERYNLSDYENFKCTNF